MRRIALAAMLLSGAVLTQVAGAGPAASGVIAFVGPGAWETIRTVSADGTGQRTIGPRFDQSSTPTWSPDGTQIAFGVFHGNTDGGVGITTNVGGTTTTFAVRRGIVENVVWSPDGQWLAFARYLGQVCNGHRCVQCPVGLCRYFPRFVIYLIRPNGTGLHRLNAFDGNGYVWWAPDSRRLIVSRIPLSTSCYELDLVDLKGRFQKLVSGDCGVEPNWSPDGKWIAYDRTTGIESSAGLSLVRSDGRGAHTLTSGQDTEPVWSPDGSRIAFTHRTEDGHDEIAVVAPDGSGRRTLATGTTPVWSPDGSMIAFGRKPELWVMASDGSGQHLVAAATADEPWAAWKPR